MNKIIVLGCGYLGYNIASYFRKSNLVHVLGLTSFYVKFLDSLFTEMDIFDEALLEKIDFQDAVVIDCTMLISPAKQYDDEEEILKTVLNKYERLYQFLNKKGVSQVISFSSGGTIYGNIKNEAKEEDILCPKTFYGDAKVKMEVQLQNSSLPYTIVRLGNLYGGLQEPNKSQGIIPVLLHKAVKQEEFLLWGKLDSIRDYIFIDDFLVALEMLVLSEKSKNQIFNIGSGIGVETQNLISLVEETCGEKVRLKQAEIKNEVHHIVLDISKMKSYFEFDPKIRIRQGIQLEYKRIRDALNLD